MPDQRLIEAFVRVTNDLAMNDDEYLQIIERLKMLTDKCYLI